MVQNFLLNNYILPNSFPLEIPMYTCILQILFIQELYTLLTFTVKYFSLNSRML